MNSVVIRGEFRPSLFTRLFEGFRSWNRQRIAVRELNAMSDGLLRDIGIERHQIRDAVANAGRFAEITRLPEAAPVADERIREAA